MLLMIKNNPLRQHMTDSAGFSLVEMGVVLTIVALLMAGLLPSLSSQLDLKQINETRTQMEEIRASLLGFAVANGRLPCPDTDTPPDGVENFAAPANTNDVPQTGKSTKVTACSSQSGGLPYNQLGTPKLDPYNGAYIYRITSVFGEKDEIYSGLNATGTLITTSYFKLSNNGTLRICMTAACSSPRLFDNAVAVIVSRGKNWALTPSTDELENINNTNDFVSRDFSSDFDDLVVWISPNTLFNRMVSAGKLP